MDASNHPWKFELAGGVIIKHGTIPNRGGVWREYPYLVGLWSNMDASNRPWKCGLGFGVIIKHGTIPNRGGV
jgi:hypothetical protein